MCFHFKCPDFFLYITQTLFTVPRKQSPFFTPKFNYRDIVFCRYHDLFLFIIQSKIINLIIARGVRPFGMRDMLGNTKLNTDHFKVSVSSGVNNGYYL